MLTIGISLLFLALFYFIIDAKGFAKWSFPFVLIGLNPITIYMAHRLVNFKFTSDYILTGIMNMSGDFSGTISAIGVLGLELLLLYFLYKRKILLKI